MKKTLGFSKGNGEKMDNILLSGVDPIHSLYVVHLQVDKEAKITVGKLGSFTFPKGKYLYVGSAKRNIEARLKRHIKKEKSLRWHFDYLRPYGIITKVDTFSRDLSECELLERTLSETSGQLLFKGFGSSDCKCKSHLIYTKI